MLRIPSPCDFSDDSDVLLPVGSFFAKVKCVPYSRSYDKVFLFFDNNAIIISKTPIPIKFMEVVDVYKFKIKNLQSAFDLNEKICYPLLCNSMFKFVDPENKFFVCFEIGCRTMGILDLETLKSFLNDRHLIAFHSGSRMVFASTKYIWLAEWEPLRGFSLDVWRQRFEDLRKQKSFELFWSGEIDSYVQKASTYIGLTDFYRFPTPFVFVCDENSNSFFLRMQKASKLVIYGEPILRSRNLLNFNACFYKDNVIFWRPLANHNLLVFPPISMSYITSKKHYLRLQHLSDPFFAEFRGRLDYIFLDPEENELIVGDAGGMSTWSNYLIDATSHLVHFVKPRGIRLHPACNVFRSVSFRTIKMSKESKKDPFIRRRIELAHPYRF